MFSQASVNRGCGVEGRGVEGGVPEGCLPGCVCLEVVCLGDVHPAPEMATAAGGTHPTGMHTCY